MEILPSLSPLWFWWIIAGILLILELLLPGVFLIWLALAAASMGVVAFFFDLAWPWAAVTFAGFSVAYVYLAAPFYSRSRHIAGDIPNLNQRIYNHVGKDYVLTEPIVGGEGKLNIGGTRWDILGPDLVAGSKVHVSGVEGQKLRVRKA